MKDKDCLTNFRKFNPSLFLKESKLWKKKISELKIELLNMPELPAIESSGVQSSGISNLTQQQAFRRMEITEEIEKYARLLEIRRIALDRLTEEQRELINGFYFGKRHISAFVADFGSKHYVCDTIVYRMKNEALDSIADTLEEFYSK